MVGLEVGGQKRCLGALQQGAVSNVGGSWGERGPSSRQGVSGCHPQAEDESRSFTLTSETNTATVTQLSPGHIYGFQVRARTAAGHGPFGGKVYFQTLPQGERRPRWDGRGPETIQALNLPPRSSIQQSGCPLTLGSVWGGWRVGAWGRCMAALAHGGLTHL